MKKDKTAKDEALISTEMFKAFDMSRGFGDWLDLDLTNVTANGVVDEKDEELSDAVDKELDAVEVAFEEFEEYEREREKQRNILTNIGSFKILVFKYV